MVKAREIRKALTALVVGLTAAVAQGLIVGRAAALVAVVAAMAASFGVYKAKNEAATI